jgi:hypothetical protein
MVRVSTCACATPKIATTATNAQNNRFIRPPYGSKFKFPLALRYKLNAKLIGLRDGCIPILGYMLGKITDVR